MIQTPDATSFPQIIGIAATFNMCVLSVLYIAYNYVTVTMHSGYMDCDLIHI